MKVARDADENIPLTQVSKGEVTPFISLPSWLAVTFTGNEGSWWRKKNKYCALDIRRNRSADQYIEAVKGLTNLLEVNSLISLPIFFKGAGFTRFYIGANEHRFSESNLNFMFQLGEQIMPVVQNIQLLDDLASKSAGREREKISRDLHDSTIQPYLGLKFKLEALLRKLSPEEHLYHEVEEVVGMVTRSVANLRGYISDLKEESVSRQPLLIDAVKQQAEQIMKHYSIKIDVEASPELQLSDRLAAEVFQMVSEGLSNIRRHTKADHALVRLLTRNGLLTIIIENNNPNSDVSSKAFSPRSLTGRAKALGGSIDIKQNGVTTIVIKIPI
jgi:signal transduction histidine kinase